MCLLEASLTLPGSLLLVRAAIFGNGTPTTTSRADTHSLKCLRAGHVKVLFMDWRLEWEKLRPWGQLPRKSISTAIRGLWFRFRQQIIPNSNAVVASNFASSPAPPHLVSPPWGFRSGLVRGRNKPITIQITPPHGSLSGPAQAVCHLDARGSKWKSWKWKHHIRSLARFGNNWHVENGTQDALKKFSLSDTQNRCQILDDD